MFQSVLQRGRAHVSAEGQLTTAGIQFCRDASTGPRSGERGRMGGISNALSKMRLQRGRAHVSAEGNKAAQALGRLARGFNGAALT